MYEVPTERYRSNMELFRRVLEVDEFLHVPVRQLSLGQRMRGDLAAALLHDPSILYLDEPTIGLDVVGKQHLLEAISEINRNRGVTVLLTTHNLADVERLCPRIILIDHGRVYYDGALERFKWLHAPYRSLVVQLAAERPLVEIPGIETIREGPARLRINFPRGGVSPHEVIGQVAARYEVRDLSLDEPSLEDIIRRLYERGEVLPTPVAGGESTGA